MKLLFTALALAATGLASAAPVTSFVGSYGNSDYYVVTDSADGMLLWTEAEAAAVTLGGHLVAINDAAEADESAPKVDSTKARMRCTDWTSMLMVSSSLGST